MTAGRPPKPAEQKRRIGNPGKRALPDIATVTPLPAMQDHLPPELGEAGSALWSQVTSSAVAWLAPSDHPTLMMLCELADQRTDLREHVANHGYTVLRPIDEHMVANPAVAMLSDVEKRMVHIASLLGLTPADRTRMGLAEVRAQNAFEQMMANKNNRGPT